MSETKKKKWDELRKPFAKNVVKPAPKGGYGSYVPHHIYTRRLVDSGLPYNFRTLEVIKGTEGYVIAVLCELDIDGTVVGETGDVDQNVYTRVKNGTQSEGELVKFAVSDAFKRCMMRHGVGLELWEQDLTEEEYQTGVPEESTNKVPYIKDLQPKKKVAKQEKKENKVTKETGKSLSKNATQLNDLMLKIEPDEKRRKTYQIEAYNKCIDKKFSPEVKEWDAKQMGVFLDLFEQAMNNANDKLEKPFIDKVSDVETIMKTEVVIKDIDKGGEDMANVPDGEWQEKPVSEAQLKWVKDIVAKATDQNLESLAELKELFGDGNITGGVASQIITGWKDKV